MDTSYNNPNNNTLLFFMLPIMVILTILAVFYGPFNTAKEMIVLEPYGELSVSEIRIIEVVSGHAWKHGAEVNSAFDCLGKHGSTRSFRTYGFKDNYGNNIPTNLWLCYNGKEWFAIITTTFQNVGGDKIAKLVTAYEVSTDLFPTIDKYIGYVNKEWMARGISYVIEAGTILLQPK